MKKNILDIFYKNSNDKFETKDDEFIFLSHYEKELSKLNNKKLVKKKSSDDNILELNTSKKFTSQNYFQRSYSDNFIINNNDLFDQDHNMKEYINKLINDNDICNKSNNLNSQDDMHIIFPSFNLNI